MTTQDVTPAQKQPNTLRTALLVIGSIVLAAILVVTITRVAFLLNREDTSGTFSVEQRFDTVELRTSAADVDVEYADVEQPEIRFDQGGTDLRLDYDVSGGVLKIRVDHPGWGWFGGGWFGGGFGDWGWNEGATLRLALPEAMERDAIELRMKTTAGDLALSGEYGDVELESTAGNLRMSGAYESLRIGTTAGDQRLEGVSVSGALSSESTAGDSSFELDSLPASMDVQSTAGNVRVTLPRGDYRIETDTTAGEVRQNVSSDQSSDRVYRFETTAGDIELNER